MGASLTWPRANFSFDKSKMSLKERLENEGFRNIKIFP